MKELYVCKRRVLFYPKSLKGYGSKPTLPNRTFCDDEIFSICAVQNCRQEPHVAVKLVHLKN